VPEGPEIRRAADRIGAVLVGQRLEKVWLGLPRIERFADELVGCRVEAVESRGKALLVRFDLGLALYAHNQLYGVWHVRRRDQLPKTRRSLRVALHTGTHSALLYSASEIAVLSPEEELLHPYLSRLGPDVLDPSLTWRRLSGRLNLPAFRNRALSALYLDQGFLAGVGNYLRSEILFAAGLHPRAKPRDLASKARDHLARQTLLIARRAYETGGVTNPEGRVAALKSQGLRRRDYRFAVFARAGEGCPVCGRRIERTDAGARRLYLCPACQPEAGGGGPAAGSDGSNDASSSKE
jgi:endonuclease-8